MKSSFETVSSLLEDGVLSGFTDDEVGPLDHHNGHEEGGVAGVLQDLPVPAILHSFIAKHFDSFENSWNTKNQMRT